MTTLHPVKLNLAVVGAGPAGLALALHAARTLPQAAVTVYDARRAGADAQRDPRTIALSLGSVQLLERLGAWPAERAQPIVEVHVSQQPPGFGGGDPALRIRASEERVAMLGAVLGYGDVVAPLQAAWLALCEREPARLRSRFETPVAALKNVAGGVEVDAAIVERCDLAVVAEGGVFAEQARRAIRHDYRQTAWVGTVRCIDDGAARRAPGVAYERFTRHGPAALLPLRAGGDSAVRRAALVWCVPSDDDPVAALDDAQRVAVLNSVFHRDTGRIAAIEPPLKHFALGLNAERSLVDGRTVRIGNAAQTLHPVAGQGLNLGLRDAFELVRALDEGGTDVDAALRRLEWRRSPDRWGTIAATDFLARSFTWHAPGLGAARGLGLAALQALAPARSLLARRMMFGARP